MENKRIITKFFVTTLALVLLVTVLFASSAAAANPGDIVINEIMQNPNAVFDSAGEWFELYNAGASDVDVNGWTIADNDFDSHVIANGGPLVIPAGGYLVLGNNADTASNGGVSVDYSYGSSWFLANGADEVVLLDDSLNEIDRVEYDGGPLFPDPTGASMALSDPALDNNDGANWCTSSTPFGSGDLGTPGAANDCVSASPQLVINEIMQNPNAVFDSAGEWFELYNAGASDVDVNGWTIADNDFDSHVIANGGPLVIPAGGYLVLGNNADTASNGGVSVDYSYGSSWFLANGADEVVLLDDSLNEIDRVEYDGGPLFPDPTGASMALSDPALDNNDGTNWCTTVTPYGAGDFGTPGAANDCPAPPPPEACGDPITPIYDIQGNGLASLLAGNVVSTEGVVVGDFQSGKAGFFLQDTAGDSDAATSDGIFVFYTGTDVNEGDLLRVRGTVDEFFDLTEITSVSQVWTCSTGNSVTPTVLTLPVTSLDDFEPFEGMLVTIPQTLYISEYFNFDRFGEIVLTTSRQFQPTAVYDPGSPDAALLALNNSLSRITLDDGRGNSNPDPAIHPNGNVFDLTNLFRGGDTVQNVTGALDYNFGLYKIQPTQGADYNNDNPRTAAPDDVGGNVKVASFNVLNYFTTLDDSGPICGPAGDQDCRGADDANEFTRQRDKIIAAISAINADVVGLMEIENHPLDVPTEDLVSGLNVAMGPGTYDYIPTGATGSDAIRLALIYKPATVTPVGSSAILDDAAFVNPFGHPFDRNRPAVAQTFMDNNTGGIFTIVVNHLKSKSGSELDDSGAICVDSDPSNDIPDCDQGDGQAYFNATRTAAAQKLIDWLATDPTGSGDEDFLIIGDLNSYDKEDPIDAILAGADDLLGTGDDYTDLPFDLLGEYAYSYVFDGQLGYLDSALANEDLMDEVTGVTIWHINADEADLIDYDTSFKKDAQDAIYASDAYRSSDHDPVIVGLDICDEIAPTFDVLSVTPDTLWPADHKYFDVEATVLVIDNFDPNPTITLVSVESNEPDNGEDDGNTVNDIVTVDDFHFQLRAERSGVGSGRIYTITYMVTDACGNSTTATATVSVPLSQGN